MTPTTEDASSSAESFAPRPTQYIRQPETQVVNDKGDEQDHGALSAPLSRSSWALIIVLIYSMLVILSWVILCVLSYRPIKRSYYDRYQRYRGSQAAYDTSRGWFQAARVIQSITTVVTIPVTSAVCARAAVVYTQTSRAGGGPSLRQMITLSDRGWLSPKVAHHLIRGKVRKYGTSFLYIAMVMNLLGAMISPIQSGFLKTATRKMPNSPRVVKGNTDVFDLLSPDGSSDFGSELVTVMTRSAITTTSSTDPQSRLWSRGVLGCNVSSSTDSSDVSPCYLGGATLDNMTQLEDPFLAQLPSHFNTGLVRQFLPRMNSSATRDIITTLDYPDTCESFPGALYIHYAHSGVFAAEPYSSNWSLSACMPADQTESLWRATRDRQDITESLYLNITIENDDPQRKSMHGLYKITMNTTLGYFELPNYFNGQMPGPLRTKSPLGNVSSSTWFQSPPTTDNFRRETGNDTVEVSKSTVGLQQAVNKGPLLSIAMALFGPNSFIANGVQHPDMFLPSDVNYVGDGYQYAGQSPDLFGLTCIEQAPMIGLLYPSTPLSPPYPDTTYLTPCVSGFLDSLDVVHSMMESWILTLADSFSSVRVVNAFEAAAFLANEAWLVKSALHPQLEITYDHGREIETPEMSMAAIILVSLLLTLFLTGLFALSVYARTQPVWTRELDAFAMMRIGSSISDRIPFLYSKDTDTISTLDLVPGWIGDGRKGQGEIGDLELGVLGPLQQSRSMHCFA